MEKLLFVVIVGLVFMGSLAAENVPPGYDAGSFARTGVGVRAKAMGGAFVAVAEGATAGYWNPAGLSFLESFQVEGMYTNWLLAGIDFQYVALAGYPLIGKDRPRLLLEERPLTFGLTWVSTHIKDIPWWEEEGEYGTFDAWSHLFILSTGWQLEQTPSVSIGVNLKAYHDRILEGRSFGIGLDAGLLWRGNAFGIPVSFGIASTDLGNTKIQWHGTTGEPVNYVPWLVKVGIASKPLQWILTSISYEWGVNRPRFECLRVGVEVSLQWFTLRIGYEWGPFTGVGHWTLGGGVVYKDWIAVDYAHVTTLIGESHLVSIKISL